MKVIPVYGALILGAVLGQRAWAADPVVQLDIDTQRTSASDTSAAINTQPGFTSIDATDNPEGASASFGSITTTLFGGIATTGSRNRTPNATIQGTFYEALLRDFVFRDGASVATALRLEGLDPGTYDVQSFHYDALAGVTGAIQVEVRDPAVAGSTQILVDNFAFSPNPALYQITVTSGQTLELVFREDDGADRSRFNGIIITPVPEPGTLGSISLAALVVLARRRRRPGVGSV